MHSRISIRGCVRQAICRFVGCSVGWSHMSWNHAKVPFLTKTTISTRTHLMPCIWPFFWGYTMAEVFVISLAPLKNWRKGSWPAYCQKLFTASWQIVLLFLAELSKRLQKKVCQSNMIYCITNINFRYPSMHLYKKKWFISTST